MHRSRPMPAWLTALLVLPAALGGGFFGLSLGEAFGYAIARLFDRDVAELKDMLIWCILSGAVVTGLACVWLLLVLARAGNGLRRIAGGTTLLATSGAIALILVAYDWPKSEGIPVIDYELRLPAGLALPERSGVDVTVWTEKSGQGCSIAEIRQAGDRPEIAGSLVISGKGEAVTMSLGLSRQSEGHWTLPFGANPTLEKSFGPWQRIDFLPQPRAGVADLPPGPYEIRYRVRRFM